ncbi:MAG: sigma-70 family RNA polymerase sigma factor [Tannerellaceae bacterium]|jgi:RNA polymerase sigma-70 factor (ECF subfamily)|nr:sigma-70 family RNA polymerase sigma factor [Tannerellaceae bacterium]
MDAERFRQKFLPLHARLYRIACALTGSSRDAEDILQEAYCKLWLRRRELSHVQNTEAFCTTLVKNLCFDFLRSSARREPDATSLEDLSIASRDMSPEAEAIEQDEVRRLQYLIGRLPASQQQALRLHSIEGCSPQEIEEITGLSAANIRVLLHRARKLLREQYLKLESYERRIF